MGPGLALLPPCLPCPSGWPSLPCPQTCFETCLRPKHVSNLHSCERFGKQGRLWYLATRTAGARRPRRPRPGSCARELEILDLTEGEIYYNCTDW
jgi:hypothetical protein